MFLYGIGILPLIRNLKELHPDVVQPWYADDAAALAEWYRLVQLYDDLILLGKGYGYFSNAAKCKVVVREGLVEAAVEFFNTQRNMGFEICTGTRYLGGYIGCEDGRDKYITKKVLSWESTVRELAMVANQHYPHSAYTGLTKSLQHQWTYFQRVIPNIAHLFDPVENAITGSFIPAIYGESVRDSIRLLASLPVKCAGLAITNPVSTSQANYNASTLVCSHLPQAIQGKSEFYELVHQGCLMSHHRTTALREDAATATLLTILEKLNPKDRRIITRGCQTGAYLSAVPSSINGSTLGEMEFQDSIRTRVALAPLNLPATCDGCGENFSITHAHACKNGGNIIARHDEVTNELISMCTMAFKQSAVRAEPQIQTGSSTTVLSDSPDAIEKSDRGDVLCRGLWSNGQDAILDIRVTDTDQASYVKRDPEKVLQSHEKEKKKKYLRPCQHQRRAFTPFVMSVDGMLGQEAKNVLKQI